MATPPPVFHSISLSADHFHDGKSSSFYSILERAATTAAVVASVVGLAATVGGKSHGLRGLYHIRRSGAGIGVKTADEILVLLCLRSGKAQSHILITQSLSFLVVQVVDDAVTQLVDGLQGVAIVRLSIKAALHIHLLNVTATGSNLLLDGTGVHRVAISNILDASLNITATRSQLRLNCVAVLQSLIAQSANGVVDIAEIAIQGVGQLKSRIANTVVNPVQFALNRGEICGKDIPVSCTAAVTAAKAAVTVAPPAEQQEDDDPNLLP